MTLKITLPLRKLSYDQLGGVIFTSFLQTELNLDSIDMIIEDEKSIEDESKTIIMTTDPLISPSLRILGFGEVYYASSKRPEILEQIATTISENYNLALTSKSYFIREFAKKLYSDNQIKSK